VNNVTIYNVDLLPADIPDFFRSGMNATVDFKSESKDNALLIPVEAVRKEKEGDFVMLKGENGQAPLKRQVKLGITDDKNFEVISGLTANDKIIVKSKKYALPAGSMGSNPFSPFGQKKKAN